MQPSAGCAILCAVATRLKKLKVREVSLVPRGANPHARVLLHKGASRDPVPQWASRLSGDNKVAANPLTRFMDAMRSAVTRVAKNDAERAAVEAQFDEAEAALASEIDASLDERTEADDAFDVALRAARDAGVEEVVGKESNNSEGKDMPDEAAVLKMFGAASAEELQAKIAKAEEAARENTALKEKIAKAEAANAETALKLQKMLDDQAKTERVAKARTMLGEIANDERVEALATVMAKLDATEVEALGKVMKAGSDAIEIAKLFEPSRPVRSESANSANARLSQIAKSIESAENVSAAEAMNRAMNRNRELAAQAVQEDTNTMSTAAQKS